MSFVSLTFIVFLPIVFLLYWFVARPLRWQNLLVLAASYVFYGWWNWRFLSLIALTTLSAFLGGLAMERLEGSPRARKWINAVTVALNLGILATFKYYDFFVAELNGLLARMGYGLDWPTMRLVLPVGISFYTFQAVGYSIDVYRRKVCPTRNLVAFASFISFFPQLVAGPIERAGHLLPQFTRPRTFDYARAVDGCRQMLWGFFKKLVIADTCAVAVNSVWADVEAFSGINLVVCCILFSFQVYGDFSGYSDIAIGCARLFGIDLTRNFDCPYFSRSIPEFWRRWHISLMTWLRDYVYYPLGGSRCSRWRTVANTFAVFLVSGLWHGANWTFLCYGAYHATLCSCYTVAGRKTRYAAPVAAGHRFPTARELWLMVSTFSLVSLGRILFRAPHVGDAVDYVRAMCGGTFWTADVTGGRALVWCVALVLAEWVSRDRRHPLQFGPRSVAGSSRAVRWMVYLLLVAVILFVQGAPQDFIYFQF